MAVKWWLLLVLSYCVYFVHVADDMEVIEFVKNIVSVCLDGNLYQDLATYYCVFYLILFLDF